MAQAAAGELIVAFGIWTGGGAVSEINGAFALISISVGEFGRFAFADVMPSPLRLADRCLAMFEIVHRRKVESREAQPGVRRLLHVVCGILEVLARLLQKPGIAFGGSSDPCQVSVDEAQLAMDVFIIRVKLQR